MSVLLLFHSKDFLFYYYFGSEKINFYYYFWFKKISFYYYFLMWIDETVKSHAALPTLL